LTKVNRCASITGATLMREVVKRALLFFLLCFFSIEGLGQEWTLTSAPFTNWASIACSADGTKVIAAVGGWRSGPSPYPPAGPIYISTNSGLNWIVSGAPITNWSVISSSADGTKLASGLFQYFSTDPIYSSIDSGVSWYPTGSPVTNSWVSLQSSADGRTIIASFPDYGHVPGGVFVSTNWGVDWTQPLQDYYPWPSVACSADGKTMAASDGFGYPGTLQRSTDSGQTWSFVNSTDVYSFALLSLSADGNRLVAAVRGSGIYISTNLGNSWQGTSAPNTYWGCLASSADTKTLVAAFGSHDGYYPTTIGSLYFSTNSGMSWSRAALADANWASVASSADGAKLFAADSNGGIYTWQTVPAPALSIGGSGTNLLLSWLVPSRNFVLQQNLDLATTNWTDVVKLLTLNFSNLHYEVTVPEQTGTRLFRLALRPATEQRNVEKQSFTPSKSNSKLKVLY